MMYASETSSSLYHVRRLSRPALMAGASQATDIVHAWPSAPNGSAAIRATPQVVHTLLQGPPSAACGDAERYQARHSAWHTSRNACQRTHELRVGKALRASDQ